MLLARRPLRRAPALSHPVLLQNMFYGVEGLSDCNKRAIHDSFSSQNSNWPYSWGTLC